MTMNLRYTVNSSGREKGSAFGCKIRGTGLLAAWAFSFHGQIEKLESDACLHQNGTQMILNCIWRTKRHRFLQCERPSIAGVTRTLTANKLRGRKFRDTKHIWSLRRKDEYVKQCTEYYSPLGLLKLKVYSVQNWRSLFQNLNYSGCSLDPENPGKSVPSYLLSADQVPSCQSASTPAGATVQPG